MTWRRVHLWTSLILLVQSLLWILSGIGFAVIPRDEMNGKSESRGAGAVGLPLADVHVPLEQLASTLPEGSRVTEVTLRTHGETGKPVYRVRLAGAEEPSFYDAQTAAPLPRVTEEAARRIAQADFSGDARITGVEWIEGDYQKGYDYYGELPAYRVNFGNAKGTRIYVSPFTGEILARRNVYKTAFDLCWNVHMFGYIDRDVTGNVALIVMGGVSLLVAVSGSLLYVPYLRRRRAARQVTVRVAD